MSKEIELSQMQEGNGMYMDIKAKEDGKYSVFMAEVINGERQPTRIGFLDLVKTANPFMTVRAPIRETAEDGSYVTRPRQKEGKFLDAKGKPVETAEEAALEFVYKTQKDDASKLVYGQVAVLNVKNTKADGNPTAFTLINAKVYSDAEALECERIFFKMSALDQNTDDGKAKHTALKAELAAKRKEKGMWMTFFIGKGADALREMGFEVRERDQGKA